jgi:hypothetical protein
MTGPCAKGSVSRVSLVVEALVAITKDDSKKREAGKPRGVRVQFADDVPKLSIQISD